MIFISVRRTSSPWINVHFFKIGQSATQFLPLQMFSIHQKVLRVGHRRQVPFLFLTIPRQLSHLLFPLSKGNRSRICLQMIRQIIFLMATCRISMTWTSSCQFHARNHSRWRKTLKSNHQRHNSHFWVLIFRLRRSKLLKREPRCLTSLPRLERNLISNSPHLGNKLQNLHWSRQKKAKNYSKKLKCKAWTCWHLPFPQTWALFHPFTPTRDLCPIRMRTRATSPFLALKSRGFRILRLFPKKVLIDIDSIVPQTIF